MFGHGDAGSRNNVPQQCNGHTERPRMKNKEVDRSRSAVTSVPISPERRSEARMEHRYRCSYEVAEVVDEELAFIEQGEAFALNRSPGGVLLITGHALQVTQLIEVHTSHSRWGLTVNVYEIRWTRPIQVESLGNLCLAGCRRIFGPRHCLSF